jgi:hypothetical protein
MRLLAFPEEEIAFQLKLLGKGCQKTPSDQLGSHHGKGPFLGVGEFLKEKGADCKIEDRISEKF